MIEPILAVFAVVVIVIWLRAQYEHWSAKNITRQKARRLEAFSQLLGQRFPDFSEIFTLQKCQAAVEWAESSAAVNAMTKYKTAGGEPRDDTSKRDLGILYTDHIANLFSDELQTYANREPGKFYDIINMCLSSSKPIGAKPTSDDYFQILTPSAIIGVVLLIIVLAVSKPLVSDIRGGTIKTLDINEEIWKRARESELAERDFIKVIGNSIDRNFNFEVFDFFVFSITRREFLTARQRCIYAVGHGLCVYSER